MPQPVTLPLDQKTQPLVGLGPIMVLASSVLLHVSAGAQNVAQSLLESTSALTAACVTSVTATRRKLQLRNRQFPSDMNMSQLSNS